MRKRDHLRKLKKETLESHKWLPSLLNLKKEEIERDPFIESRLLKLKKAGFYPHDIDDPAVLEQLKKHPVFGAKHILDLFEFRDILLAILSWKDGNIRIFTRIFSIKDYTSRGRQWRTQLAGDVLDAWFKNHKFRYLRNSFYPEVESYTDEMKLKLAAFLKDFTIEQHISACEVCSGYFLRHDARYKNCGSKDCSLKSVSERREKLRRKRERRLREYWDVIIKGDKKWGNWRKEYRSNRDGARLFFLEWYGNTYPVEFEKLKSYGLIRAKR